MTNQTLVPTSASDIPTPHEASHGRSRRWLRIGVVLAIVAVAVFVAVRRRTATQTSVRAKVAAESKPIASVIALGSIVPGNSVIHLNAPASSGEAMLQALFVRENEHVTKSQIVGTLDSIGRLKAAVSVARAQVAQEQAAFDKVAAGNSAFQIAAQRATVERLRAEAQRQASDVERYRSLHTEGIISDSDWETRSVAHDQATASLREAESTLKLTAEVRPVDLSVAESNLISAKASLESAEANVEQANIRAPEDGEVLHVYTWPGERVGDSGVLDMAPSKDTFVEAEVYETDISRVHEGQSAVITAAALKEPVHGTVALIEKAIGRQQVVNTDPAANTDARVAIVRVRLDPASRQAAEHLINLQVRVEFQPR